MKRISGFLQVVLYFACIGWGSQVQGQTYPVWVTAMPIPSATVYLGDFAHIEATAGKLNFMLELRDPVEPFREVYFRLHVIRNGTTVMMTNPNILPPRIRLNRNTPVTLNGTDLSFYFDLNNLIGVSSNGVGNVLTEDYYSICIEVVDFLSQKVISDKVCASGWLNQLAPPLLYLPRQGEPLSLGQAANLMFNWQLTAGSPPYNNNISYLFELRELAPGLENTQEYFENNTLVYQTEVQNNSLIYGVGLPPLVKDVRYLWRVRALARDDNGQELVGYFHNNGISEIWDFTLPNDPAKDRDFCHATPPKPPKNQTPMNMVFVDDVIHVGHFDLLVTDLQNASGDAVKGSGQIFIPFLDIAVDVAFNNLKVNEKLEAFGGGITAKKANNWLAKVRATQNGALSFEEVGSISEEEIESVILLSQIINEDSPNLLPLSISRQLQEAYNVRMPYDLIINDMWFTDLGASFNAVMLVPDKIGGYARFGVSGVGINDSGFDLDDLKLFLLDHTMMSGFENDMVSILAYPGEINPEKGSFIAFDCGGFDRFNLQGKYRFDKDILVRASNISVPASASLHIESKTWGDVMGAIAMTDFAIPGMDEWRFEVLNGWVDFSSNLNLSNIQLPKNYTVADEKWRGFYISDLKLILPYELTFGYNQRLEMTTEDLIIDEEGVTFSGNGFNLLPLGGGNAGGWGLSFDELQLNIAKNEFEDALIKGQIISVPILDTIEYNGRIFKEEGVGSYALDLFPQEDIDIPFLNARIEPDVESVISIRQEPPFCVAEWRPYANINGPLHVLMPEEAFKQFGGSGIDSKMASIKDSLNAESAFEFDLAGIELKGFKINHPKLPEGRYFGIDRTLLSRGGVSLADVKLSVEGVDLLEEEFEMNGAQPGLGLGFHVSLDSFGVRPKFWAINESRIDAGPYNLAKIEIEVPKVPKKAFACDCTPTLSGSSHPDFCQPPAPYRGTTVLQVGSTVQVGHFNMEVSSLTGNSGTGRIAIPYLGGELNVDFSNIQIDNNGMLVQGTVQSAIDESFSALREEALQTSIGEFKMRSIVDGHGFVQNLKDHQKKSSDVFSCPLSIGNQVHQLLPIEHDGSFEFILMGINFSADVAKVNCMALFTTPEGQILKFGIGGLDMRPNGFNLDGLNLFLTEESTISAYDGRPVRLLISQPGDPESGSYISFDCDGFNSFRLKGIYTFDHSVIVDAGTLTGSVEAYLDINTPAWDDFDATVKMSPFAIPGLDGWSFEVLEAGADFSDSRNLLNMQFPPSYISINPGWEGFFISKLRVTMPEELRFGSSKVISFESGNLVIDRYGVSGLLDGYGLLSLSTKKKSTWRMSMDRIELDLQRSRFVDATLNGLLKAPSFSGAMAYVGKLYIEPVSEDAPNRFYAMSLALTGLKFSNGYHLRATQSDAGIVTLLKRPKLDDFGRRIRVDKHDVFEYKPFANYNSTTTVEVPEGLFLPSRLKYNLGGTSLLLKALGYTNWTSSAGSGINGFRLFIPNQSESNYIGVNPYVLIEQAVPPLNK